MKIFKRYTETFIDFSIYNYKCIVFFGKYCAISTKFHIYIYAVKDRFSVSYNNKISYYDNKVTNLRLQVYNFNANNC